VTERSKFKQVDITKLLKGARAVGYDNPTLVVQPDGTIILTCSPTEVVRLDPIKPANGKLKSFDEAFNG
jgi:hypothetical protein